MWESALNMPYELTPQEHSLVCAVAWRQHGQHGATRVSPSSHGRTDAQQRPGQALV